VQSPTGQDIDLLVVGAGVAGLTAATMAARHGLKVVVVDRMGVGGQISTAETIENFPGFPQGIGGHELGPLLHEQAEAAGAEFLLDTVEAIEPGRERHQGRSSSRPDPRTERLVSRAKRSSSERGSRIARRATDRSLRARRSQLLVVATRRSMRRWCWPHMRHT
jgi:NADPH-dependent 2,4-dienoyl-CoA reductase/sulfur reductase-like enzyme